MVKQIFLAITLLYAGSLAAPSTASAGPTYDCINNGFGTVNCHDTTGGGTYQRSTACSNSPVGGCVTTWIETPGSGLGSGYPFGSP